MAKVIANRHCIICAEPHVQLWTLDNLQKAAAVYLCRNHSKPLQELLELAGSDAPDDQVPVPLRDLDADALAVRRQSSKMVPLLDWTPPD